MTIVFTYLRKLLVVAVLGVVASAIPVLGTRVEAAQPSVVDTLGQLATRLQLVKGHPVFWVLEVVMKYQTTLKLRKHDKQIGTLEDTAKLLAKDLGDVVVRLEQGLALSANEIQLLQERMGTYGRILKGHEQRIKVLENKQREHEEILIRFQTPPCKTFERRDRVTGKCYDVR